MMEKCIVSGCPNRAGFNNRAVFNRPPRRFFRFPKDPNRVKVWLAALRETEKDPSEQHVICEDHFLPEDISKHGVGSDSIPLMPPYLDGLRNLISPWIREPLQEEEQWLATDDDDDGEEEGVEEAPASAGPPQQDPDECQKNPPVPQTTSDSLPQSQTWSRSTGTPLSLLTRGFLELLMASLDGSVDIKEAATSLQTPLHRVQNIISILQDMGLVQRTSGCTVRWIGYSPICSFLWRTPLKFLSSVWNLKQVEVQLDGLIRICSQQLFDLTDNQDNSASAYVTLEDISHLKDFQDQTVIAIRSPPNTKLNIPPPDKKETRMHLMAENDQIVALACEVGSGCTLTSDPTESSRVFTTLEKSRIRTYSLLRVQPSHQTEDDANKGRYHNLKKPKMGPRCQSSTCARSPKFHCCFFRDSDREKIFRHFWEEMNWDQRIRDVRSLVEVVPVQRRRGTGFSRRDVSLCFFLNDGGCRRRVCRVLFLATLGLNDWQILKWVRGRPKCKRRDAEEEGS